MVSFGSVQAACALTLSATVAYAVNVSVSPTPPGGVVRLHPALVSFSIEQDRWTDWIGTTETNQYFLNTLQNLADLQGETPHIRVGANTEDRTNFDYGTEYSTAVFPQYNAVTPYPEATDVVVGDKYYEVSSYLPEGTHVTWGLNLGRKNLTAAWLMAKSILRAFDLPAVKSKGIVLDFLEIGNEGDLYGNNGQRNSSYSPDNWVSEWITFGNNITESFNLTARDKPKWLAGSFAGSSHNTGWFSPQAIIDKGILESEAGKLITTISQHRYSAAYCSGSGLLLQELMRKTNVRGNLTDLIPDIQVVRSNGLDYIGGEMNSVACHGAPGVSNTAGAALWALDYTLFAASIDISQMFFHEGIGFKYDLIQPATLTRSILDGSPLDEPLPPHVQPQYYGGIAIAEAVGKTGQSKIIELTIDDPFLSGYAIYEGDALKRAVLINSKTWLASDDGSRNRTSTHVTFDGPSCKASVKRLGIKYAEDTKGLTWGGVSYETANGLPEGEEQLETVRIEDGVDVQETEAVLVNFL